MNLFSSSDVARLLGVAESKLAYEHRAGRLQFPEHVVGGVRIYLDEDLHRAAAHFGRNASTQAGEADIQPSKQRPATK